MFSVNGANCPKFVGIYILSFLEPQDLGRCLQVNKAWNKLASNDSLWKPLLTLCNEMKIPVKDGKVWELIILSPKSLGAKIEKNCKELTFDQKIRFNCHFIDKGYNNFYKTYDVYVDLYWKKNHLSWLISGDKAETQEYIFIDTKLKKDSSDSSNSPFINSIGTSKTSAFSLLPFKQGSLVARFHINGPQLAFHGDFVANINNIMGSKVQEVEEKINSRALRIASAAAFALSFGLTLCGERTLGQLTALISTFALNIYFK